MSKETKEIDAIVFKNMRQLGIEVGDDVTMSNMDKTLLYSTTVFCINLISKANNTEIEEFPTELPKQMALTFRVCEGIASCLQDLGFKKKLTYDVNLSLKKRVFYIQMQPPTERY
jgi:hypothetical protein